MYETGKNQKPHFFFQKQPKNSPVTTKISGNKKMKLVKTVKNFHRKNETGKICKKSVKTINFSKTPLKSVTVPQ